MGGRMTRAQIIAAMTFTATTAPKLASSGKPDSATTPNAAATVSPETMNARPIDDDAVVIAALGLQPPAALLGYRSMIEHRELCADRDDQRARQRAEHAHLHAEKVDGQARRSDRRDDRHQSGERGPAGSATMITSHTSTAASAATSSAPGPPGRGSRSRCRVRARPDGTTRRPQARPDVVGLPCRRAAPPAGRARDSRSRTAPGLRPLSRGRGRCRRMPGGADSITVRTSSGVGVEPVTCAVMEAMLFDDTRALRCRSSWRCSKRAIQASTSARMTSSASTMKPDRHWFPPRHGSVHGDRGARDCRKRRTSPSRTPPGSGSASLTSESKRGNDEGHADRPAACWRVEAGRGGERHDEALDAQMTSARTRVCRRVGRATRARQGRTPARRGGARRCRRRAAPRESSTIGTGDDAQREEAGGGGDERDSNAGPTPASALAARSGQPARPPPPLTSACTWIRRSRHPARPGSGAPTSSPSSGADPR